MSKISTDIGGDGGGYLCVLNPPRMGRKSPELEWEKDGTERTERQAGKNVDEQTDTLATQAESIRQLCGLRQKSLGKERENPGALLSAYDCQAKLYA